MRMNKGDSLLTIKPNYVVLDIETTGFEYPKAEIIEISAKKYRNYELIDNFSTLVKPKNQINSFITNLTGINNNLVNDAPDLTSVLKELIVFLENEIIVAHNANFDINFLYDAILDKLNVTLNNDFIDTLRLSRNLVKGVRNHKLQTLADYFNLSIPTHRAEADVIVTNELYIILKDRFSKDSSKSYERVNLKDIVCEVESHLIDQNNYFYGSNICISGQLETISKTEAFQKAVNLGANIQNNVTLKTNILVYGDLDYQIKKFGKKSSKHLRAEDLLSNGHDIDIISEYEFIERVNTQNKN